MPISTTFVAGVVVYVRAAYRQDQERYLDYRALAEALRVAVYWKLLGIGLDAKSGVRKVPMGPTSIPLA